MKTLLLFLVSMFSLAMVGQEIKELEYPPKHEIEKFENLHDGGLIKFKVQKGNIKATEANYKSAWHQARINCGKRYVFAENDEWRDTKNKKKLMEKKYITLEYSCAGLR